MVGKPQKRTLQTKQNILAVAAKLFDSKGFNNISVEEIAEKAGVAKATVFSHFGDKTSLLIAVKIIYIQDLLAHQKIKKIESTMTQPDEILFQLYQPWLVLFRDNPDFVQLFLVQSALKSGPWSEQFIYVCNSFQNIITTNIKTMCDMSILPKSLDIQLSTQAVQAFYYHVLSIYLAGFLDSPETQETLLKGLIEQWFKNN